MATPKPGEIRCPTCHRSTPPAAFCTQCGSAIPTDARIRPRGMDRDELQERIRARRSGGEPYRRGSSTDDEVGGYARFEPEPEDSTIRRAKRGDGPRRDHLDERAAVPPPPVHEDLTRDQDEWEPTPAGAAGAAPPSDVVLGDTAYDDAPLVDRFDDAAYADDEADAYYDDEYDYDEWDDRRERRSSGGGAFAIVGFLALGVLALVGGAILAGLFNGSGTGQVTPTETPIATIAPAEPTPAEPTPDQGEATPVPTPEPPDEGEPIVFPDGFTAEAQPCLPGSAGGNGCDSNAVSNSGSLWVWVGFRNGTQNDVIGADVIGPDGSSVGTGSIDLARIGCRPTCPGGWTYFPFQNLEPGTYEVEITRNGQPAGSTTFEVT